MAFSDKPILYDWRNQIPHWKRLAEQWIILNRWKVIGGIIFCLLIWQKDLSFQVQMTRNAPVQNPVQLPPGENPKVKATSAIWEESAEPVPEEVRTPPPPKSPQATQVVHRSPQEAARYAERMGYVQRFAQVAQTEMRKYGIPASITLAQGLLESNSGKSGLSRNNNNHFGIKCHSRSCGPGHCSNFSDDSHKDFFRIFSSAWESYRAHSLVLQRERYQFLYDLPPTDYQAWAHGLKKAGYATDPKYGEKLINLIESLELYKYDRI
jgi:hypothetical protein